MNLEQIELARRRIAPHINLTPVFTCSTLSEMAGAELVFKCENFQKCGSFKVRGAMNAMLALLGETRRRGVLTFSSGNFGQALAYAGKVLEVPVTVVMPGDAPPVKIAATRGYGAEVVLYDRDETTREALGNRIAEERGLTTIPPYDHLDIIAGQGTVALELAEQCSDLDSVIVPCGGGGLLAGCAIAAKGRGIATVVGAEPEQADDAARSHAQGEIVRIDNPVTVADGARTPSLGNLNFPLIRGYVDTFVTVSEEEIMAATLLLWERAKLVVEPTGALGLAAALKSEHLFGGKRVGVVLSGGNVDLSRVMGRE